LDLIHSGSEWIQVDLKDRYVITGVATQGRYGNGVGVEYFEEFWLEYTRDNGTTWKNWTDIDGNHVIINQFL
jgi:discoidin domain receptor family protein 2